MGEIQRSIYPETLIRGISNSGAYGPQIERVYIHFWQYLLCRRRGRTRKERDFRR